MGIWLPKQKPPRGTSLNLSSPLVRGLTAAYLFRSGPAQFDSALRLSSGGVWTNKPDGISFNSTSDYLRKTT